MEKKEYKSPKAEKLEFDFNRTVTASGTSAGAGNFVYGEDDTTGDLVYLESAGCAIFMTGDDVCMGC